MRVKIKVENEAAGMAVFNALVKHGATDCDSMLSICLEGKGLKNCFICIDSLIEKKTLKKLLKTWPWDVTVK